MNGAATTPVVSPVPAAARPQARRFSAKGMGPLALVTGVWLGVFLVRHTPFVTFPELRADVLVFLGAAYAVFAGAFLFARGVGVPNLHAKAGQPGLLAPHLRQVLLFFAIVGAAGSLARGIDMLFLRGIDYSAGFSAARLANMAMVESSTAGARPLSAAGRLLMGCSTVAMLAAMLRYERIPRGLIAIIAGSWLLLLVLSIVEGGRNTIAVNLLLLAAAGVVRRRSGKRFLPFGPWLRTAAKAAMAVVVAYALYVFVERFAALGYADDTVIDGIEAAYSVKVAPAIRELPPGTGKSVALSVLMVGIYFGHGIDQLAPVFDWVQTNPLGYGRYNLDLVAIALGHAGVPLPRFDFSALPNAGLYYTALGELVFDLGRAGALVVLFLAGLIASGLWHGLRGRERLAPELMLAFALAWLLASPLYSIVSGFLGVIFAMAVFQVVVRLRQALRSRL